VLINLKALIVVLTIAIAVFVIARPICLRFIAEADFLRRRNIWITLTVVAFVSPSFWLFVGVAIPLLAWAARKDATPVALCVLVMQVIPPIAQDIPVAGVNQLFSLYSYRILSIAILVPVALRLMKSKDKTKSGARTLTDILMVSYCLLQLVLLMPYETTTNTLRRGFLFSIDILALYYVVSRSCTSRRAIVDTMASYFLACAILAPLAMVESLRSWLLYQGIGDQWGSVNAVAFVMRADALRAQVSAGHPLVLGEMLAIAFGIWLYLGSRLQSKAWITAGGIWIWMGLIAAYSRSPWLSAGVTFFTYLALVPKGAGRFFKAVLVSVLLGAMVLVSPIGGRVIDNLPFVGTINEDSVAYRQLLAERSWELIKQNPLFGSPFVLQNMEDLRQGEGIIDLVNSYASVTLFFGVAGLCLFIAPVLVGLWNSRRVIRRSSDSDRDLSLLGAALIACTMGMLFNITSISFVASVSQLYWLFVGLMMGYIQIGIGDGATERGARANAGDNPAAQSKRS
jgi:hypothetical protein